MLHWINTKGRLVVGGKLLEELNRTSAREWAQQALNAGLIRNVGESDVNIRTEELQHESIYKSDDPHVLALAQISGARLLYSNDLGLQDDFKNKSLINYPRGEVYSTREHRRFEDSHKHLLKRKDLCRTGQ